MNKKLYTRGVLLSFIGGVFWGFSGTCGQFLFDNYNLDCTWLTSVRLLTAGIILTLWVLLTKGRKAFDIWKNKKDSLTLLAFGIAGLVVCQYTYLATISHTNAGTATVLEYSGLILVMLYTCVRLRKLPSMRELISVVLVIVGVVIISTHGNLKSLVISREGLMWGIASAVGLMLYTVIPERLIRKYQSPVVTAFGMLTGGIVLFTMTRAWQIPVSLDIYGYAAMAGIIIVGTVIAYTCFIQGVGDIGAVRASVIACIEPVSATVISSLWLGTKFSMWDIVGFVLIMVTVIALSLKDGK